ncbi:hypothetical protein BGZ49_001935 [Haplosporangium sp. Z 27]|nr:hypothetical protein BGZ49_001935 [Haplosporangium sp. Z 27]
MAFRGASFLLFVNWLCIVIWLSTTFESTDATIIVVATNDSYIDRTAAFGPRIPDDGLLLNLIPVETLDPFEETTACRPVNGAPKNLSWVALVERGGTCTFADKVRNMQASGAKAVIVGDNQKSGLLTMPVLDVIIFIILSPAFVVLFLFFIWKLRMRQQRLADLAPAEVVNNLPIKVFFKSKVKDNDPVECVICLEDYVDEDELRILPCRHQYHVACIDNWLTNRKKFCPICKRDICVATETTPLLGSSPRLSQEDINDTSASSSSSSSSASSSGPSSGPSSPLSAAAMPSNNPDEVAILVDDGDSNNQNSQHQLVNNNNRSSACQQQ